ncbi:hypothetical protein M433DRAFT_155538 [Acidomyces richmondensis BFW]|nr:MAG: hypothetical protein FE78DRAFT_92311 [Acidomyces sp. 'richmondensis']KYG44498.1 hypothetical protein M433DRAFT_155538 [Acidomyces richmondensis BFW]
MSSSSDAVRLPAFLTQSRADIHAKFIDLEWQQRDRLLDGSQAQQNPTDPPSKYARLTGDAVAARNRYMNVEPYAQNRVKLRVGEGGNDYINASPITLGTRRYIATQGPKDTGVHHFYRMLAHEVRSPAVVVMLTQTHEAGREKCFPYYPLSLDESPMVVPPDEDAGIGFQGEVVLEKLEESAPTRSQIRHLRLKWREGDTSGDENDTPLEREKQIYHLLFSGWPDFLTPEGEDRAALIELIRLSASLNRPPSSSPAPSQPNGNRPTFVELASSDQDNPRIIHCSAGVGRSGTFIALDYLLSLLHAGELDGIPVDRDPVAETVDMLRQQRMMMVQSEAQFYFIYEVLREQYLARFGGDTTASENTEGEDTIGVATPPNA